MGTTDTNYPYTYSCDFLRGLPATTSAGTKLNRGDAGEIRKGIAAALDMTDGELACKLADHYLANQEALDEGCVQSFYQTQSLSPSDIAGNNIAHVVAQRLSEKLDGEQVEQALQALNGTRKDD